MNYWRVFFHCLMRIHCERDHLITCSTYNGMKFFHCVCGYLKPVDRKERSK